MIKLWLNWRTSYYCFDKSLDSDSGFIDLLSIDSAYVLFVTWYSDIILSNSTFELKVDGDLLDRGYKYCVFSDNLRS